MSWIELTITAQEVFETVGHAVGETADSFIARVLEGAGFTLETKLGRRLIAEPYEIERDERERWITYRQWTGAGDPPTKKPAPL